MEVRKLSIIIPVYNERQTLPILLERVRQVDLAKLGLTKEIIIVDDCSKDGTADYLKSLNLPEIKVFHHETNQGKGAALHTGLKHFTGDFIIIQDADLEYDPNEYERVLKPLIMGVADVVYGSRFIGSSPHHVMYFGHYLGNKFITFCTNLASNLNLTDIETCYKAFTKEAIRSVNLKEKRFGFEPEVTIKLAKKRWRFYEVGISYYGRSYAEGKKIRWTDGVRALYVIFKYWLFA